MACLLSAPCCEVERAPGRDVFQMLERAVDAPAEMCCRHMVLHQMGDELDGPSPIYPCDGEAATGDSFMLPATSDRNALRLTMGSPPLVDHAFFGDQRYALAQAPPISIAR